MKFPELTAQKVGFIYFFENFKIISRVAPFRSSSIEDLRNVFYMKLIHLFLFLFAFLVYPCVSLLSGREFFYLSFKIKFQLREKFS